MEPPRKSPVTTGEPKTATIPSQPLVGTLKRSVIFPNMQKKRVYGPKATYRAPAGFVPTAQLTSCVGLGPVTLISAHPGGEVRRGPHEEKLEKPQQLCASWRLQALKYRGTEEEHLNQSDFAKTFKIMTLGHRHGSLSRCAVGSVQPTTSLSPFWKAMIPEASHLLSLFSIRQITSADIQRQTRRVKKARQRLAAALQADRPAREAERRRGQEEGAAAQPGTGAGAAGAART